MSLFDDCCCSSKKHDKKRDLLNCEGCVCAVLNQLQHSQTKNAFTTGATPQVNLLVKGTNEFVDLQDAMGNRTNFTFVSFNPETCCATFTYRSPGTGTPPGPDQTKTIIFDCRSLAAISPIPS
ncbi:MAG: hypothetical protein LPK26_03115 [Bacillaceae bacterium]|nr:hypothetical protein [Bacillaceae bacterium]